MTSILFLIETIERNQFTCYYLKNKKVFLHFIFPFSKSTLNFKHFQTKRTLIAQVFPKLRTPKNLIRYMSKKSRIRGPFDRQHGKREQTLLQSERQNRYHNY